VDYITAASPFALACVLQPLTLNSASLTTLKCAASLSMEKLVEFGTLSVKQEELTQVQDFVDKCCSVLGQSSAQPRNSSQGSSHENLILLIVNLGYLFRVNFEHNASV
jgi:hypothetical protein